MSRLVFTLLVALLVLPFLAAGCGDHVFHTDTGAINTGSTVVNPNQLVALEIGLTDPASVNTVINTAPSRALLDDVALEFYDAKTMTRIAPFAGPVYDGSAKVTVTLEAKGVVLLVKVVSKTAKDNAGKFREEAVILGLIPGNLAATDYTTVTVKPSFVVSPMNMLALRCMLLQDNKVYGDEAFKWLGASIEIDEKNGESPMNYFSQMYEYMYMALQKGFIPATDPYIPYRANEVLAGLAKGTLSSSTLVNGYRLIHDLMPIIRSATPASIAESQAEAPAGRITLHGGGFGVDPAKLKVSFFLSEGSHIQDLSAGQFTVDGDTLSFNLTAAQAAQLVGVTFRTVVERTVDIDGNQDTLSGSLESGFTVTRSAN